MLIKSFFLSIKLFFNTYFKKKKLYKRLTGQLGIDPTKYGVPKFPTQIKSRTIVNDPIAQFEAFFLLLMNNSNQFDVRLSGQNKKNDLRLKFYLVLMKSCYPINIMNLGYCVLSRNPLKSCYYFLKKWIKGFLPKKKNQ